MVQPLFKSSIPLLFGGSYHLLKATISRFFQNTSTGGDFLQLHGMKQNLLGDQDLAAGSEGLIFDTLNLLNQASFGVYSNLFAFLLTMLLIDLFIKIYQNGFQEFWKEVQSSRISLSINRAKEWRLSNLVSESQMKKIFSYAGIFMFLQIIGFGLSFTQSEIFPSQPAMTFSQLQTKGQEEYFDLTRILEEEEVGNEQQSLSSSMAMTLDKMSLSMGNILNSLSLNVNAMVLSKDKKTAFVTIDYYGTLHIIDLSDLHSPFIMGSLNLEISAFEYRIKSLALSSDEKTLFISNSKDLEIIDVTDSSSPKLISRTTTDIFGFGEQISVDFKTSLAVSESTNTLYIGGLGLQVYDISDLKKPVLLKAFKNDVDEWQRLNRNELCLSRDEKVLFIANRTLDVYNVSNPKKMKLLYSFETESSPRSILLSEDFKTVFLLGTDEYSDKVIFEEADISRLDAFQVKKTIYLGDHRSRNSPRFLAVSPSKSKFFILANSATPGIDLLIFDRLKQTTIKNEKSLIEDTFTMDFALDGKTLITGSNGQFMTIELFLEYPNTQIFSKSQDHLIKSIRLPTNCTQMKISSDGQHLFIVRKGSDKYENAYIFEILDLKNSTKPTILSSYNCGQSIKQMHLTSNFETVYLLNRESIFVLDIKNRSSINLKNTFNSANSFEWFDYFITSSDEKTGFLVLIKQNIGCVTVIDLSKPSGGIEGSVELMISSTVYNIRLILKDDDKTLVVLNKEITIYNISNLLAPVQIASMPFGINESETYLHSHLLSPNNKTLFIETFDESGYVKLRIYNISDATLPQILSEKLFSKNEAKYTGPGFQLSFDLKSGFVSQQNYLIKLNLTNLKKPGISGIIPLTWNKSDKVYACLLSPDNQTIYASVGSEIRVINPNIQYTLFLKQEKFLLGEKYSDTVAILNLTGESYNFVDTESYKVIKLSLMDIKIAPNHANLEMKTSLLPSWMIFDRESNMLTVESKKQRDVGTYTLCSNFSLKIPHQVFENLGTAEHPISSEDLVAWLISLDYVDPQLYLTANFRSFDTFYLPSNFSLYREDIYNILKSYHVETCTLFEVVSSLKVEETKISTLSTSNIKVEVKLEPKNGSDAKFVNRPYGSLLPTMKDNKTKISLEGTLKEINTAVSSIVVNFENGTESDASIVIIDGLNGQVSKSVNNISKYFRANRAPYLNKKAEKTIQEQIDSANIQTGVYFTLALSENSFEDDFAESLKYELKMAQNNTAFPTWLDFKGLTLKGSPPEDIFGRDIDLVLIAKNEFKHSGVPVKLHIKISAVFWLKLLVRYSPYMLTLIGLLVSANKIFNILSKGFYKHPKEFYVGVGEEISNNVIFPVSFIKEEQKQSELILKEMRHVHAADFMDSSQQRIDKDKVISAIKEAIKKMSVNMKKQITLYPSPMIDQIILNRFVWMQLDGREEMKTKRLFEDLKANCLEVIENDGTSSSGFMVNQNKLNKLMKGGVQKSPGERDDTLEESLISHQFDSPGVNIHLLKDAILAFAFENYSLDVSPVDVDIGVKQKVPKSCLFRFLKLDLKDIYLDYKNKINYGLNYQIIGDKLSFYGMAQDNLKGKTLVIQIKNRKHRIMKEIWINGVSNDFQKDKSFMIKDEQEMRGQGYEIY